MHTVDIFSGPVSARSPGNVGVLDEELRSTDRFVIFMGIRVATACCGAAQSLVQPEVHREERGVRVESVFMERVICERDFR